MQPKEKARLKIDNLLSESGRIVQDKKEINLGAGIGVAIREYYTHIGPADYILFVNRIPVGIIEAKKKSEGVQLPVVEEQSEEYSASKLKHLDNKPLPFVYESTGTLIRFRDNRDLKPRAERHGERNDISEQCIRF